MALVTHPIYAKDWSFDAPPPYSLAESTSHVQSSAVPSSNNKKNSNKRRAQELGDDDDRRVSIWPSSASAQTPPASTASTAIATQNSSSIGASKKAKLSDSEDGTSKDAGIIPAVVKTSVAPKMEHVLMFLVDALTSACSPATSSSSSSSSSSSNSSPAPTRSSSPSPIPVPTPPSPTLLHSQDADPKTVVCNEPDTASPSPQSPVQIQTQTHLQTLKQTPIRPIKSLTPPTSPLSDAEDRVPYVRKTLVVRQACAARTEQKLGRWVLAKNHFLSIRCLDPRTQSIEWQQSLHNIGWEPLHPYFQAQAEAEFEAAAVAAAASSRHFSNTLSEWIEDDFDAEYDYEENEYECDMEGDEEWGNEDDEEEDDEEFILPRQNLSGAHTGVWDSSAAAGATMAPQKELSLDDCRC